jgi:hypothetical protein
MEPMTSLDADLVRRWFGRLRDPDEPAMPHWGIVPTAQEAAALAEGEAQIEFAVQDLPPPRMVAPLSEVPARLLRSYLEALAAGITGTRRMLGSLGGADAQDDTAMAGDPDALALVTGLNAAAAALHGQIDAPAYRPIQGERGSDEPTAAEAARLAGLTAAELVVDGADLQRIAGSAAGAAMNGWQIGLPQDPAERDEYRTRGLVGILLYALAQETRDPEPPADPASCGALPGENLGRRFDAEITFSMGLPPTEIRSLTADLAQVAAEVTVWPSNQWPRFHVHSDRPGEVIGQVYAYGTPFDLMITDRD